VTDADILRHITLVLLRFVRPKFRHRVLSFAGIENGIRPDLPSWVPQWGPSASSPFVAIATATGYQASGFRGLVSSYNSDLDALDVSGSFIGIVKDLAEMPSDVWFHALDVETFRNGMLEWERGLQAFADGYRPYLTGEDMLGVYWQTLTANLDHNLKPADKEFGECLKLWRDFHSPGKGLEDFEASALEKVTECAGVLSRGIFLTRLCRTQNGLLGLFPKWVQVRPTRRQCYPMRTSATCPSSARWSFPSCWELLCPGGVMEGQAVKAFDHHRLITLR
jgi:hypothetical protein